MFARVDIFGEIQLDVPKSQSLTLASAGVFLQNFEVDARLLQQLVLAYDKTDRNGVFVFKVDLVFFDRDLLGPSAMLGGCGGREMPFDEAITGHQGYVVKVEYAKGQFESRLLHDEYMQRRCRQLCPTLLALGTGRWPNVSACALSICVGLAIDVMTFTVAVEKDEAHQRTASCRSWAARGSLL